jgi:pimeloyl-CoA dehydrogenase small subunit
VDFTLSDEQRLLQDSIRRLVDNEYGFDRRKIYAKNAEGFSRENWRKFAELGMLGLPFSEADGGSGGSGVEVMLVMEQFGRGLVLEPYLASVLLAGGLIAAAGSEAQRHKLLSPLIEGRLLLAFAHGEPQSRYTLSNVETTARRQSDDFVISGRKAVVLHGDAADKLIVSARVSGDQNDPRGIALFVVDKDAPGLAVRGAPTIDGLRSAEVSLADVRVGRDAQLGGFDDAFPVIAQTIDAATAAICAEAVGIMSVLLETTLDYLKTRQQFGAPIGRNQALQHRVVDMRLAYEQARSMALLAAMSAGSPDDNARRRAVSAAKVQIGRSGKFIGQQAIQLHGGIAMTDEYKASHYFKRLTMIGATFGDVDHHLGRFSDLNFAAGEAA